MTKATEGMMATKRSGEDALTVTTRPQRWPVALIIVLLIGGGLWFSWSEDDATPSLAAEPVVDSTPAVQPPPVIPVVSETLPNTTPTAIAEPITSDNAQDRLQALLSGHPGLDQPAVGVFAEENMFARLIAIIDALSRGAVPYKLLPLTTPMMPFPVVQSNTTAQLDTAGFARYDELVNWVVSWEPEYVARLFHAFRPALEQGYAVLGYAPEQLDDAVLGALDNIAGARDATPGALLVKKESVWRYADADLERRSGLEKQMMRMGPTNSARLRIYAGDLKRALRQ